MPLTVLRGLVDSDMHTNPYRTTNVMMPLEQVASKHSLQGTVDEENKHRQKTFMMTLTHF